MAQYSNPAEAKADYNKYLSVADQIMKSPDTQQALLQVMSTRKNDPVRAVAAATVMLMQRIDAATREKGIEIMDIVRLYGGMEIIHRVSELAVQNKFFKFPDDYLLLAVGQAVQGYIKGEIDAGRMDANVLAQEMQQSMKQIPPSKRQEIMKGAQKVEELAKRYQGGRQ